MKKRGEILIENSKLETFPNEYPDRDYVISLTCPEFTAVCPMSGFPDFGTIFIYYVPSKHCIELKSLKLYINSYRNVGIFHEHVVNKILDDFVKACKPRWALVDGDYNVRGNVKTVVRAEYLAKGCKKPSSYLWADKNASEMDVTRGKIR